MFHPIDSCEGIHPDNGSWRSYLTNYCKVLDQFGAWTQYASTNCHYIVYEPLGLVYSGVYGYHGFNFFKDMISTPYDRLLRLALFKAETMLLLATLSYNPTPPKEQDYIELDRIKAVLRDLGWSPSLLSRRAYRQD